MQFPPIQRVVYRNKFEALYPDYRWGQVKLDEISRQFVAATLSLRAKNPPLIPYGISAHDSAFDEDGNLIPLPVGQGLTCATFITAFLTGLGFPPIDLNGWPDRADDQTWQANIIDRLETYCFEHGISAEEHIAALRLEIGAERIRPSEATASVLLENWPLTYEQLHEEAVAIERDVEAGLAAAQGLQA